MDIKVWIRKVQRLPGDFIKLLRTTDVIIKMLIWQQHYIRNAVLQIFAVAKIARKEGRLSDQEFMLIMVSLSKIEGQLHYVQNLNRVINTEND